MMLQIKEKKYPKGYPATVSSSGVLYFSFVVYYDFSYRPPAFRCVYSNISFVCLQLRKPHFLSEMRLSFTIIVESMPLILHH